jgi:hypothetical protein
MHSLPEITSLLLLPLECTGRLHCVALDFGPTMEVADAPFQGLEASRSQRGNLVGGLLLEE